MKTESFFAFEKVPYPTGTFLSMGGNLHALARDESSYMPPVRQEAAVQKVCPIIVPTRRNIPQVRKNIENIMQLANGPIVFLCSGEAKKEAIAEIAKAYPQLTWVAIDGPYAHDDYGQGFETTYTSVAYGSQKDVSQKRNLGLLLARLVGWKAVFFIDDDVTVTEEQFYKAIDLLQNNNTAVVGFSARNFPDLSVTVHARRLVNGPIDTFIGSGAMAVRTDKPILSFFPHVYNEDWLFLLVYCLFSDEGVVWAGTIDQRAYNPFSSASRAKIEEPGDILGESLVRLAMSMRADLHEKPGFEAVTQKLAKLADKAFWENEINTRISFIRDTQDAWRRQKIPTHRRRRALQALDSSLERLIGVDGRGGLRAEEFSQWVEAWVHDLNQWHTAKLPTDRCRTLPEAMRFLGLTSKYLYAQGSAQPPKPVSEKLPDPIHPVFITDIEPVAPRSSRIIQKLEYTQIVQQHLATKGSSLQHIVTSANRLRFDRPAVGLWDNWPHLTISMIATPGESIERISRSLRDAIGWSRVTTPLQFVLWIYGGTQYRGEELENYRDRVTARLVGEAMGTNVLIRSSIIAANSSSIDHIIDDSLSELAFAYWKCNISADHPVFVVNSSNELLRHGTFWEFMQGKHKVPHKPLSLYLRALPELTKTPLNGITHEEDENALAQARLRLARKTPAARPSADLLGGVQAIAIEKRMKRAHLTWVQTDDLAYNIQFHHKDGQDAIILVPQAICIPLEYNENLPSDKHRLAREVIALARSSKSGPHNCMVVLYGRPDDAWSSIERYRSQLMKVIREQKVEADLLFSSMTYRLESDESMKLFKKRALAVALYMHWLQNHAKKPSATWQELGVPRRHWFLAMGKL